MVPDHWEFAAVTVTPCVVDSAVSRALLFLDKEYEHGGFQSIIGTTPGLEAAVVDPTGLFGPRADFPREVFSPMVVLDLVYRDRPGSAVREGLLDALRTRRRAAGHFDFFEEEGLLPTDVDTTALGLGLLVELDGLQDSALERTVGRLVANTDGCGVVQVYLPPAGDRAYVDATVCANVLHLLLLLGQPEWVAPTEDHLYAVLAERRYLAGTRYYPSPDAFLHFLARAVTRTCATRERFGESLRAALEERAGCSDDAMELAMRILGCHRLGLRNTGDVALLLEQQRNDGSWPPRALYRFGRRHGYFGSTALTTAFAVAALDTLRR
jgi:hypothetical protein